MLKKQKIKKVMKGLQKASKTHAAQAKTLTNDSLVKYYGDMIKI